MTRKTRTATSRRRPSPALVISCVALFLALAGSALALPKDTVRSAQIVNGTIRTVDLRNEAVKSAKVADQSLTANDLGPDSVGSEEIAENAVASPEVAPDSLTAGDLGAGSVASSEVADQSLSAADLGTDSVGPSEVAANAISADELATVNVRTASEPIEAGKTGTISVGCLAGEQILGGGGQPGHFGVEMTSSRPSGNGWLYQAFNKNGSDSTITVYALCLTQ
jgi:hypothetical protein